MHNPERPKTAAAERRRRSEMWQRVEEEGGELTPTAIGRIGIRPAQTGQGVFRDQARTGRLASPEGVTLTLFAVGTAYDDSFDEAGGLYHYPSTNRGRRDSSEIEATKNCKRLKLPLFVILSGSAPHLRSVRRGWVVDWDDTSKLFLLDFHSPHSEGGRRLEESDFRLNDHRRTTRTIETVRPGQSRFRFEVYKLRGVRCAVCDVTLTGLLEAVHICPFADGGPDDPRNGLVMCRNHQRAFDLGLFAFDAVSGNLLLAKDGPSRTDLGITRTRLDQNPPQEALAWRLKRFKIAKE